MRALDPRLLRHARASRRYLWLSVGVGLALTLLVVAQAVLLADAISAVVAGRSGVGRAVTALAVVVTARAALVWLQEVAAQRSAQAVKAELRQQLFAHTARLGPAWLTGERGGALTALATRGIDALDGYLARYLPQLVLAVIAPVAVLAWIVPADLVAALTILVTLPLIPVFLALVGWSVQRRTERQFRALARMSHHFLDIVAGLPTLKLFGRAKAQVRAIIDVTGAHRSASLATLRLAFLSSLVLEFIATISVALVAVGVGLRLVNGSLDLRTALLVLILAPEAYLPLRQLGAQHHASAEGLTAAAGVFAILETSPPPAGVVTVLPGTASLRWCGVTVSYADRPDPALAGFDLSVGPGEIVGLTGPSGAGKSTALAAALGLVPLAGGAVMLAGGGLSVGVAEADPDSWRCQFAWVPQSAHLIGGTVADNVRLGRPGASDADVAAALALAHAAEFVDALPLGVQTRVGAGGRPLSAGQRQRVALARAYLRGAPILLLDEPTAGLDEATEAAVLDGLRGYAAGRCVVMVAHRPAALALAERVVRLAAPVAPAAGSPGPTTVAIAAAPA